jgi:mannosyltransferase OCH1-like enzyme
MIPKIIFTSFKDEREDNEIVDTLLSEWEEKNPEFEVRYFSDNDLDEYFESHPRREVFEMIKSGVARADYFRACYLQSHGGTWFDFDFGPFSFELPVDDSPVILYDMGNNNYSYMLISSKAGESLWEAVLDEVDFRVRDPEPHMTKGQSGVPVITGPRGGLHTVLGTFKLGAGKKAGSIPADNKYHTRKGFSFFYAQGPKIIKKTPLYAEKLRRGYLWSTP